MATSNSKTTDFKSTEVAFASKSNFELLRAKWLFSLIQKKSLVKFGTKLLKTSLDLGLPVRVLIKNSVFDHFCGGETLEDCQKTLEKLQKHQVACILDYGVEGEKSEEGFQNATKEIMRSAKWPMEHQQRPFVVFKFTAIADSSLLEKISAGTKLSDTEQDAWSKVLSRVDLITNVTSDKKLKLMIDAEETWIQEAIDQEALKMMRQWNKDTPLVYATLQMYRQDSLSRLHEWHQLSQKHGFKLGIKLVRGAYMDKERIRAKERKYPSPIHLDKVATDHAFNEALNYCLKNSDTIGLCIGSHNEDSNLLAANYVLKNKKKIDFDNVWFSQLLGMSDHITFNLAKMGLQAAKYVPYGPVEAVVPYLIRRAEENTSVAGESGRELELLRSEIHRRKILSEGEKS